MDERFSVSYKVGITPEQQQEIKRFKEAAGRTISLQAAMILDPAIGHYDWRGRLKLGGESRFSKIMKAARLAVNQ